MARRAKPIMLQGTGSNVGKSVLVAGLCRILLQDGHDVAPFKSQNMALNSFVTREGHEIGRAQAVQAQACRLYPHVNMNPVLIKPSSDCRAQVIVMGKPAFELPAEEFPTYRSRVESFVRLAYEELAEAHDIVVLEGAGSPAEINLREGDIVNMAMAQIADAPVIIVGDIDKGGVFASFVGTMELLTPEERARVKGFIINKFRGERKLLKPAIDFLEARTGRPVLGIVPYFTDIKIPEEDSLASKAALNKNSSNCAVEIAIVFLPHVSNFTDFDPFEAEPDVRLRYLRPGERLPECDVAILPGTKNTIEDLRYLREKGMDKQLLAFARGNKNPSHGCDGDCPKATGTDSIYGNSCFFEFRRTVSVPRAKQDNQSGDTFNKGMLIGICGGYQMLGTTLSDPHGVESEIKESPGLGLLDAQTVFLPEKHLYQVEAMHLEWGLPLHGYEIHMGETTLGPNARPVIRISTRNSQGNMSIDDGAISTEGNVWGAYMHGLFDDDTFRRRFIDSIRIRKGLHPLGKIANHFDVDAEYDKLAALLRENLDMKHIYPIIGGRQ